LFPKATQKNPVKATQKTDYSNVISSHPSPSFI